MNEMLKQILLKTAEEGTGGIEPFDDELPDFEDIELVSDQAAKQVYRDIFKTERDTVKTSFRMFVESMYTNDMDEKMMRKFDLTDTELDEIMGELGRYDQDSEDVRGTVAEEGTVGSEIREEQNITNNEG